MVGFKDDIEHMYRSITDISGVLLPGWNSRTFNPATSEIMTEKEALFCAWASRPRGKKYPNGAAKFWKLTPLTVRDRRGISCSSTYNMLRSYVKLRWPVVQQNCERLGSFLCTSSESRRVDSLLKTLQNIESASKRLQQYFAALSDIHYHSMPS